MWSAATLEKMYGEWVETGYQGDGPGLRCGDVLSACGVQRRQARHAPARLPAQEILRQQIRRDEVVLDGAAVGRCDEGVGGEGEDGSAAVLWRAGALLGCAETCYVAPDPCYGALDPCDSAR